MPKTAVDDWTGLKKRVDALASELDGRATDERLKIVGKQLEPEVDHAVTGDIGDTSLSGWTRKKPMDLTGYSEPAKSVEHGIFIAPGAKGISRWHFGLGAMRVLQDGRQAAEKGSMRVSGSRIRKKDGVRVDKRRKRKRTVGYMAGKGTWDDAEAAIAAKVGEAIHKAVVLDAVKRHFY